MGAFLMKLYSTEVKCHVLVRSHISYQGVQEADIKVGFPMTSLGRSFNPSVGRYFNNIFLCRTTGTGAAAKKEIWTAPIDFVDLKAESLDLKSHYPIKDGMAQIFAEIRGKVPEMGTAGTQTLPAKAQVA